VFGTDATLNANIEVNWHLIKQRKQKKIDENNVSKNNKRIPYKYKLGEKVLYQ